MMRRLGVSKTGSVSILACFSLATALACGGITGCGSSNSTSPGDDGGGEAGEGGEDGGPDSPEEANPMPDAGPPDSPMDSPIIPMDSPVDSPKDSPADSPKDSPADSPIDSPKDSPGDAPGDGQSGDGCTGPVANFTTTTVGLGNGNCGGAAVTTTYTVSNKGCQALTVGATITGSAFSVSPSMLSVAPGMSGTFTLSATVPQSSAAGSTINGSLTLATNDPAHSSGTVPLTVVPTGATLAWDTGSPTKAAFGTQPVGIAATPIALQLDNKGNAAVSVTFGTPSDAQFSLSPTTATNIAAGGNAALSAGFTAANTNPASASSTFTVTGAVCGTSVNSLAFTGQGATGAITGYPTSTLDFQGACGGAAPAAQTFVLTNSSAVPVTITGASFSSGATGWTTNAAGAVVPAGGTFTVSISAPAVAFPNTPGSIATPTLTLTTNIAGDTPHVVDLQEDAMGAVLAFDTTPTPNFGAFGPEPVGQTASQNFNIVNSGNVDSSVTVAAMANPPFGVGTATLTAAAGSSTGDTATFAPQTYGGVIGSLGISGTNLCQPPPSTLNLSGTGQSGGIALSTASLSFSANCGGTAATAQTFTITNTGNQPMSWTGAITSGTYYAFSPPGNPSLAAGGIDTVTVTPVALASGADPNTATYADTITITTNIVGDTAHPVALGETPLGDVLSISPLTLPFGDLPVGQTSAPQTFVITNNANAGSSAANLTINNSNAADFPASATTATPGIGGGTSPISVVFKAPTPANTMYTANLSITTSDFLCGSATVPGPVVATGTSTQAGPVVNPQTLFFGGGVANPLVNCGATGATRTITVSNSGQQDFNITGLPLATGTYYTVTSSIPLPATVQANGANTVTITVTPNAIPQTVPSVPDLGTYSDTLTIQTDANVTTPNTPVALNMGAEGVIVSNNLSTTTWDFGAIPFGGRGTFNVFLNNAGNEPVQASIAGLTQPTIFGMPTVTKGNGVMTITGTFNPPAPSGVWTDSGTLTIQPTTGNVLCQPLPASWQTPTILFQGQANGYYASCQAILSANPSSASGQYTIDPDGSGPDAAFTTYCDMTDSGGGWTLALKIDGTNPGSQFFYTSSQWTSQTAFNASSSDLSTTEAKLESYWTMGFSNAFVYMGAWGNGHSLVVPVPSAQASLEGAVINGTINAGLSRAQWLSLSGGSAVLQPNCNSGGYNENPTGAAGTWVAVRIGMVANEQNDCSSPDSYIGFGGIGSGCSPGANYSAGWVGAPNCGGGQSQGEFGYVFIR